MSKVDYVIRATMNEYSPCLVDGRKALFHRWIDKEKLVVKFDSPTMPEKARNIMLNYRENGYLPPTVFTNKISNTYGLVEFEDGHIEEVEPTTVRFIDHEKIFEEYCWPEYETEKEEES